MIVTTRGNSGMGASMFVRFAIDFVLLLIVAVPILIIHLTVVPYQRGFYCEDTSLRYPFKDSTVTNVMLYIFGLGIPIVGITVSEFVIWKSNGRSQSSKRPIGSRGSPYVHPLFLAFYQSIGVFLFGAASSQIITDAAKYTIGRLRPHFFDVCKPAFDQALCGTIDEPKYVVDFTCDGDEKKVREARLSFLSGHASFSTYCMLYLALYLQYKMTARRATLVRPFLQLVLFLLAFLTSLSRVSNYKHHPEDVIAGMIVGSTVAVLVHRYLYRPLSNPLRDLKRPKSPSREGWERERGKHYAHEESYRAYNDRADGFLLSKI